MLQETNGLIRDYLLSHESDIANSVENYGELYAIFQAVLNRHPLGNKNIRAAIKSIVHDSR